ncbi:MAG: hypothetical protein AB3N15_01275 [Paracoccaceae bacterium]
MNATDPQRTVALPIDPVARVVPSVRGARTQSNKTANRLHFMDSQAESPVPYYPETPAKGA